MRVRRQVATDVIVNGIILALVWIFCGVNYVPGTAAVLISLQMTALLLVNLVNRPAEK